MTLCYWVTTEMSADCRSCFAVSNKIPFLIKQGVDLKCFTESNRLLFYDQYSEYVSDIDINCRCRDKKKFFSSSGIEGWPTFKGKCKFQVLLTENMFKISSDC